MYEFNEVGKNDFRSHWIGKMFEHLSSLLPSLLNHFYSCSSLVQLPTSLKGMNEDWRPGGWLDLFLLTDSLPAFQTIFWTFSKITTSFLTHPATEHRWRRIFGVEVTVNYISFKEESWSSPLFVGIPFQIVCWSRGLEANKKVMCL